MNIHCGLILTDLTVHKLHYYNVIYATLYYFILINILSLLIFYIILMTNHANYANGNRRSKRHAMINKDNKEGCESFQKQKRRCKNLRRQVLRMEARSE
jgi:hypothetical protein